MPHKRTKTKRNQVRGGLFWVLLLLLTALCVLVFIYTPVTDPRTLATGSSDHVADLEKIAIPANDGGLTLHTGYTLKYSEEHEQPYWVAYVLTPAETVVKVTDREDNFRADPAIITGSATLADYRGSGYDRGHLAPFADLSWSEQSASDSFYLSNMSPQAPALNRGRWQDLEAMVRTFSLSGPICVVTGPVLTDGPYKTIGENRVSVPNYFYKAILYHDGTQTRAIGFILPNSNCPDKVQSYAVTIDDVEAMTGLDFFPLLPDDIENAAEATFDLSQWDFTPYSDKLAASYGYDISAMSPDTPVSVTTYKDPQTPQEIVLYFLYSNFAPLKLEILETLASLGIYL